MFKKISAFLFCALFSGGAFAALPVTNGSNVNVNGEAISSTNPLPSMIYGSSGLSATVSAIAGADALSVSQTGIRIESVAGVNAYTIGPGYILSSTQGTYQQATIAPAATVATLTPPANNALAGWDISITSNATLAVAGTDTITVALNGVTIYQTSVYIPATALSTAGQMYSHKQKYNSFIVPKAGSAGTFTVTLGTALATGTVNVNEYSGN